MPAFVAGASVGANVRALRTALGSLTRPLSRYDLAAVITERHRDGRRVSDTLVRRWEEEGVEPDYESVRIMAELAGASFELFALGATNDETPPSLIEDEGVDLTPRDEPKRKANGR